MDTVNTSYDAVPYPGSPFSQTHPGRLATIGTLFGMNPASIHQCRVLELGCTDGGNLIPMAVALPGSEFVGVDNSARQIEDGLKVIRQLGLSNIRLICQNIMDVTDEYGVFDYIISHGVYSWVPPEVQEKILLLTKQLLNPQGIGYVSYNTYPGWHLRGMLRDMMLFHTRQFSEPKVRIEQARALVNFLAEAVPSKSDAYGMLLSSELENMQSWSDSYIFHESLEAHNEPLYFHQFVEKAAQHGLRYLGEASLRAMLPDDLGDQVAATLKDLGRDIIEMEQYTDFIRNRTFRQTLLCHDDVDLQRTLTAKVVDQLWIRGALTPCSNEPDLCGHSSEQFVTAGGTSITAHTPIQKAAMYVLSVAWPTCTTFEQLVVRSRSLVQSSSLEIRSAKSLKEEEDDLREAIFKCFCDHALELNVGLPNFAVRVSERPVASPLARYQSLTSDWVTTLLHDQLKLDTVDACLLPHLDGLHSLDDLLAILIEETRTGKIIATRNGEQVTDEAEVARELRVQLETHLQEFARLGLLVQQPG